MIWAVRQGKNVTKSWECHSMPTVCALSRGRVSRSMELILQIPKMIHADASSPVSLLHIYTSPFKKTISRFESYMYFQFFW